MFVIHISIICALTFTFNIAKGEDIETSSKAASFANIQTTDDLSTNSFMDRSSHHYSSPWSNQKLKGFWKKKFTWRPRWVKTWQEKKVYVAVWKKMWGPMVVKEWVPVAKPPPGWMKHNSGTPFIKKI